MTEPYVKIGKLLKCVGTSGALKVDVEDDFMQDVMDNDHVFVKLNGAYVPYFIESIKENQALILQFEDVEDPESAARFNGLDIFLRSKDIRSKAYYSKKQMSSYVGYDVYHLGNKIGKIDAVEVFPQQLMAKLTYNKKEIYLPLVEALILEVNPKKQTIHMDLPDGILEI